MVKIIIRNQIEATVENISEIVLAANNNSPEAIKAIKNLDQLKYCLLELLKNAKYELLELENVTDAKSFIKLRNRMEWSLGNVDSTVWKVFKQEIQK